MLPSRPSLSRAPNLVNQSLNVVVNKGTLDVVRNQFHSHYHPPRPYWTPDWYSHHSTLWHWAGPTRVWWVRPVWNDCWGWFAAGFFTNAIVNHIVDPVPYYYGSNVVYRNGMVYVNGVPYVSAQEYYQQAQALAAMGQQPAPAPVNVHVHVENNGNAPTERATEQAKTLDETEWLPLGTFAILKNSDDKDFQRILQLATSKDGKIYGNVVNVKTDEAYSLMGAIDSKTQRVAMSHPDHPNTVIECGLWNLTQDSLTALVHHSDSSTEERTLIRLTEPDATTNDDGQKKPSPNEPQIKF